LPPRPEVNPEVAAGPRRAPGEERDRLARYDRGVVRTTRHAPGGRRIRGRILRGIAGTRARVRPRPRACALRVPARSRPDAPRARLTHRSGDAKRQPGFDTPRFSFRTAHRREPQARGRSD